MRKFLQSKKTKSSLGFTLIELLLYFSLLSILLVVVIDLFLSLGEFNLEYQSQKNINQEASFIGSRLSYEIKRSDSIILPTNLGDTTSSLQTTVGSETHVYSLSANNLDFQNQSIASQSARLNSNLVKVNLLSFQRLGNSGGKPTLKVNFTLENQSQTKQGIVTKNFELVVGTR